MWPGGHKTELRDRLVKQEYEPEALSESDRSGPVDAGLRVPGVDARGRRAAGGAGVEGQAARACEHKDTYKDLKQAGQASQTLRLEHLLGPQARRPLTSSLEAHTRLRVQTNVSRPPHAAAKSTKFNFQTPVIVVNWS